MSQTERSASAFLALLANNSEGNISPTDVRDAFASMMGYACIHLTVAGAPAVINSVGDTYELVDVFNEIRAQSIDVNLLGTAAELSPSYAITPASDGLYYISFYASFSSSANNRLVTFRPHVDGVPGAIEVDRWISSAGDTGVVAFSSCLSLAAGEACDVRVKIDAGSTNLTFLASGCSFFRVG